MVKLKSYNSGLYTTKSAVGFDWKQMDSIYTIIWAIFSLSKESSHYTGNFNTHKTSSSSSSYSTRRINTIPFTGIPNNPIVKKRSKVLVEAESKALSDVIKLAAASQSSQSLGVHRSLAAPQYVIVRLFSDC